MMATVQVTYHHEPTGWWAESPDVDGFVATGATLREVRQLAREGLPFYLDEASVDLLESGDLPGPVFEIEYQSAIVVVRPGTATGSKVTLSDVVGGVLGRRTEV